jgi:PAS domain S-box-containing protein
MSKPLRVLIVEDSEDDAQLILLELKRGGFEPSFERADTPEAMKMALDRQGWDIILADYVMPRFSGLEALKIVKEKGLDLPFIVISGKIGEDVAVAAMKAGAHDYILKNSLKRLAVAVDRELKEAKIRKERKQAESGLQRLATVLQDSNDAVTVQDFDGNIIAWNRGATKMYGWTEQEALKMNIAKTVPEHKQEEMKSFIERLHKADEVGSFETQRSTKDGRVLDVWLTVTKLVNDRGTLEAFATTERDITDRKRAEEALRVSETRYRRLFETAQDGILILDEETARITEVNPFLIDMVGYSRQDLLGKKLWQIGAFKDMEVCERAFLELQKKGSVRYADLPLETKDGRHIDVEFVGNVYQVDHKKVIQCNIRDITDRKRFEEVKDDFVSMVSHELRTPLTTIRESVSQTLDGILGEVTEQQREILSMALSDIDQLTRIINDLLDISKIGANKMKMKIEMCEMVALVLKIISSFAPQAKAKGLEMKGCFSKEKIKAYVDKDRITQVFSNLIGNAIKFTQKGYIEVSIVDKEGKIECSVSDTGPGIDKKDLPQLFDKFQQFGHPVSGEEKGTGLGLAISKGIVELHKGEIRVESQVNVGTKFSFVLPKYTGKESISEGLKKAIKEGQALSVLIFDIKNFEALQQKIGEEKAGLIVHTCWELLKNNLRRDEDNLGIEDIHTILVILPKTEKGNATAVLERMNSLIRAYLSKEGLEKEVDLVSEVIAHPDNGKTEEEFFFKITDIMATQREAYVTNE